MVEEIGIGVTCHEGTLVGVVMSASCMASLMNDERTRVHEDLLVLPQKLYSKCPSHINTRTPVYPAKSGFSATRFSTSRKPFYRPRRRFEALPPNVFRHPKWSYLQRLTHSLFGVTKLEARLQRQQQGRDSGFWKW